MNLTVPESWHDITIDQFIKFNRIQKGGLDNIDYMLQLIAVCCSVSYDTVSKFRIDNVVKVVKKLEFMNELPAQKKIERTIKLDREYVCDLSINKVSAGQYIDLKSYIKKGAVENIHNILTCFYIPKGEEYAKSPVPEIANKFLNEMSIADAYPIAVFFWNLVKDSMPIIQDYLIEETMDQIRKVLELETQTKISTNIGVG